MIMGMRAIYVGTSPIVQTPLAHTFALVSLDSKVHSELTTTVQVKHISIKALWNFDDQFLKYQINAVLDSRVTEFSICSARFRKFGSLFFKQDYVTAKVTSKF